MISFYIVAKVKRFVKNYFYLLLFESVAVEISLLIAYFLSLQAQIDQ